MTEKGRSNRDAQRPGHGSRQEHTNVGAERAAASDHALFGIVAHELRSPIAAILGYEELLAEGLLGSIDDTAREALARIRSSARQLLTLTEGMYELSGRVTAAHRPEVVDHAAMLHAAVLRIAPEADARRVTLDLSHLPDQHVPGHIDPQTLEHVLDAALGAALKTSTGRTLAPELVVANDQVTYRIANTAMEADTLEAGRIDSGAALRIRIASGMARRLGGQIRLIEDANGTTIEIILPAGVN